MKLGNVIIEAPIAMIIYQPPREQKTETYVSEGRFPWSKPITKEWVIEYEQTEKYIIKLWDGKTISVLRGDYEQVSDNGGREMFILGDKAFSDVKAYMENAK